MLQNFKMASKTLESTAIIQKLTASLATERGLQSLKEDEPSKFILKNNKRDLTLQLAVAYQQSDKLISEWEQRVDISGDPFMLKIKLALKQVPKWRVKKDAFEQYSFLIKQLLILHAAISESLPVEHVQLEAGKINKLMLAREAASIERGLVTKIILNQDLEVDQYFELAGQVQIQMINLNYLLKEASFPLDKEDQQAMRVLKKVLASPQILPFTQTRFALHHQFDLQTKLLGILTEIGYGGFIHHLKNYLLRHRDSDYQLAKQEVADVLQKIEQLKQSLPPNSKNKQILAQIKAVFLSYQRSLIKIKHYHNQQFSVSFIDKAVAINDLPAIEGLLTLQKFVGNVSLFSWWQASTLRINAISDAIYFYNDQLALYAKKSQSQLEQEMFIYISVILLSLLITLFMAWYIHKRVEALQTLSFVLEAMVKNNHFKAIYNSGQDEIFRLGKAFNSLIKEREKYELILWEESNFDALSQLPNRKHLFELLEDLLLATKSPEQELAVLFIDLDGFKKINDTQGHHAGDLLLQTIAKRLKLVMGDKGVVGRLGGDEFVILVPDFTEKSDLEVFATKVVEVVAKPVVLTSGEAVKVSASIGISLCSEDACDAENLLMHADIAMYASKANGKNCFTFYQQCMSV